MFLDWKSRHCENDYTTQSNVQIQCNPSQTTPGIFHRTRSKNFTICMETQKTPNSQSKRKGKGREGKGREGKRREGKGKQEQGKYRLLLGGVEQAEQQTAKLKEEGRTLEGYDFHFQGEIGRASCRERV